jgi:sarcosine oxidase subunit beta
VGDPDFVVVGGGVYGAALSYELVNSGSSVLLLEAGRLAQRASGGPGKRGVRANGRNSRELTLAREAIELWPVLPTELRADIGFERLGGLMLVNGMPSVGDIALAQAEAQQELQHGHGIASQLLTRSDLDDLEPGIHESEIAALYNPDEGIADQGLTAHAYANAAVTMGAAIREHSPVDCVVSGTAPYVQMQDGSRVRAGRAIVLTTNHGTNALLQRSRLPRLPLWTMVPQVLMFKATDNFQPKHLVGHLRKSLSVKPLADGITMISGGMRGRWHEESLSGEPVDEMVQSSLTLASSVMPSLGHGRLVCADASLPETYTPDGLPYIDYVDDADTVLVAGGWNGHGFAIAPAVAKHLAIWLTTGRRSPLLDAFNIRRS